MRRLVLAVCLLVGFVATARIAPSLAAAPCVALVLGNSAYTKGERLEGYWEDNKINGPGLTGSKEPW